MTESPVLGFCIVQRVGKLDWIRLDLSEAIEVELTNKRREVVMLEKLRNDFGCKLLGVLDDKRFTIV
jgi:hypothetical protein